MYYSSHDLYDRWNSPEPTIVVVQPKYRDEALRILGSAPAQRFDVEDYTVLLNQAAAGGNRDETN